MPLEELRKEIELMDDEIIAAIKKRMDIVEKIADIKEKVGKPAVDNKRRNIVLERISSQAEKNGLKKEPVIEIFEIILQISEQYQIDRRKRGN